LAGLVSCFCGGNRQRKWEERERGGLLSSYVVFLLV